MGGDVDMVVATGSNMVAFSDNALRANLDRLQDEWEKYQAIRDRDAVYDYLTTVFELVALWAHEGRARQYACRAMFLKERRFPDRTPEPYATVILCTADPEKVDYRTRSKWSRVLRYAAKYKQLGEPLASFVKRKGGINRCAGRFARRLGRGALRRCD
jgi:hypothetical protein